MPYTLAARARRPLFQRPAGARHSIGERRPCEGENGKGRYFLKRRYPSLRYPDLP